MGHAASISLSSANEGELKKSFDVYESVDNIEELCVKGYFTNHHNDYILLMEQAVKFNNLAVLELLLKIKNANEVFPLHIAAKHSQLEALELLVSAGYLLSKKNNHGLNPLHVLVSQTQTQESVECALFMCLECPSLVNSKDSDGNTPLHICVLENNIDIFEILIRADGNIKLVNKNGESAYNMAKRLNRKSILNIINPSKYQSFINARDDVDIEKIMLVWDKFFENALTFTGVDSLDEENNTSTYQISDSSHIRISDSNNTPTSSLDFKPNSDNLLEWLNSVLVYEPTSCFSVVNPGYFILNKADGTITNLEDYSGLHSSMDDIFSQHQNSNLFPETFSEAINSGWIQFYDAETNSSTWLLVRENRSEGFLPIGNDIEGMLVSKLPCYENDRTWVMPDQSLSQSWKMVVRDNLNDVWYWNPLLGLSRWSEPAGWRAMCSTLFNGWTPCCLESQSNNIFWWNSETCESLWA